MMTADAFGCLKYLRAQPFVDPDHIFIIGFSYGGMASVFSAYAQVADAMVRAARAVRLLGAQVIITGIRPEVAQTLVGMGADLSSIVTHGSLQSGIAFAMGQ